MTSSNGYLIVTRHGRVIPIQRLNDETYYRALIAFGVSEAQAQAATRGLITLKVNKG